MIVLSNGNKWIIDDKELKGISEEEYTKGNLPVVPIRHFVKEMLDDESSNVLMKLVFDKDFGWNWDSNHDPYKEILGDVATRKTNTAFFDVYEMPWGEVIVIYRGADSGGYDVTIKSATFANREEYNNAVKL